MRSFGLDLGLFGWTAAYSFFRALADKSRVPYSIYPGHDLSEMRFNVVGERLGFGCAKARGGACFAGVPSFLSVIDE